jgi:hypothetical protein
LKMLTSMTQMSKWILNLRVPEKRFSDPDLIKTGNHLEKNSNKWSLLQILTHKHQTLTENRRKLLIHIVTKVLKKILLALRTFQNFKK